MTLNVRLATFNIENLDDNVHAKPPFSARLPVLQRALQRLNADLLCLQEVNSMTALDKVIHGTQYESYFRAATDNDAVKNHGMAQNDVLLSRFPILESKPIPPQPDQFPLYRLLTAQPPAVQAQEIGWTRALLTATVQLTDTLKLHVISCHLKSKLPYEIPGQTEPAPGQKQFKRWKSAGAWAEGAFISSMLRMGQAAVLRNAVDAWFDQEGENALIAVCGDFNSTVEDVPVEAIRGQVENLENTALAYRSLTPCEQTIPEPARYSLLYHGKGEMIDHILISRQLLAYYRAVEIHNEVLHDKSSAFVTIRDFPESDHAPVVATFGFA
ncbi:MAG: endonuclease/exonuclease/phosphatase family protein [Caldilineaceae bacterium]